MVILAKQETTTTIEEGNPHLRTGGAVVPLQRLGGALTLMFFNVVTDADSGASSAKIVKPLKPVGTGTSSGVARLPSFEVARESSAGAGSSSPGVGVSTTAGVSSPGAKTSPSRA